MESDHILDFNFYQQVVSHISGSLDLDYSMIKVFDYLSRHFPIEGKSASDKA